MNQTQDRIRDARLLDKVTSAAEAASWIEDGMTLGLSGFTLAGDVKAVPKSLVERSEKEAFKVNVYTGASLGAHVDQMFAEAGIINKRLPFQADPAMRKKINQGEFLFVDQHLSHTAEMIRTDILDTIDYAIVEALAITEDGMIIPTTSIGNSSIFAKNAENIIVEINTSQPTELEGVHDVYDPEEQGERNPIPLTKGDDRIGKTGIQVDPDRIKGIVFTEQMDTPSPIDAPDEETNQMVEHLIAFLREEVQTGRLTKKLAPIQSGIGTVANAVLHGLIDSEFTNLKVYSEVLQDAVFDLIDAGKIDYASCCSITLSEERMNQVFRDFSKYREKVIMRPQEISNHPEIIRRLGLISINAGLEFDIYGNVNSTHISGTKMVNGTGGSGDFARNARLAIFVTKSIAKDGDISSIVPFIPHVDHNEHDVDILVTEQGYADLRGLAPRERVPVIIENCAHPMYKQPLWDYYQEALENGGQTPHVLEKALSWHVNVAKYGTMRREG